jgi:putative acetyltransferase
LGSNAVASVSLEDPAQPDIIALLGDGERHSASLYPAESNHHLPLEALRAPHIRFLVARDGDGRAIGSGAIALFGIEAQCWAELKQMWVIPDARGKGVSRVILEEIEARAMHDGARWLRLETGIENHAALALYQRTGFTRCGPFGDYQLDPLSVFMEKELT